jgi:hypothetical protein
MRLASRQPWAWAASVAVHAVLLGSVVIRSIPPLDGPAIAALRQWHFAPGANREGEVVRVVLEVPVRFQLR